MAMQFSAGEVSRSDLPAFYPEHIIVNHLDNSRQQKKTKDEIAALAESIRADGQLQPCVARRIEDNKVKLVAGYGRWEAISYLNEKYPDEKRKVQCRIMDLNAEEAFVVSIKENIDRTPPTAVDDAYAQRRLRQDFGWPEDRIAAFYKMSVASINKRRTITKLSKPIQEEIKAGNLSVDGAADLAKLPEEVREATLAEAKDTNGKVDTSVIRGKVREKAIENGESKSRTLKEVKAFFEECVGPDGPAITKQAASLAQKVLEYIAGSITEKQMYNAITRHCRED